MNNINEQPSSRWKKAIRCGQIFLGLVGFILVDRGIRDWTNSLSATPASQNDDTVMVNPKLDFESPRERTQRIGHEGLRKELGMAKEDTSEDQISLGDLKERVRGNEAAIADLEQQDDELRPQLQDEVQQSNDLMRQKNQYWQQRQLSQDGADASGFYRENELGQSETDVRQKEAQLKANRIEIKRLKVQIESDLEDLRLHQVSNNGARI